MSSALGKNFAQAMRPAAVMPKLTLPLFRVGAKQFAKDLSSTPLPDLYGATDGKAVGTKVEVMFKEYLLARFDLTVGSAANGLEFPSLNLDLKVTSSRQPQSSCPFRTVTQKIYGLGYNLLVIVYSKRDLDAEHAAYLEVEIVVFIDKARTGDFTLTKSIREIVANAAAQPGGISAAVEDLDALLEDKAIPLDEVSRRALAERLVIDVPEQGVLTISNALQWSLQYARAIATASSAPATSGVEDLHAK